MNKWTKGYRVLQLTGNWGKKGTVWQSEITDYQQYSFINHLQGVIAYVLRIVKNIEQNTDKNDKVHTSITLGASKISNAETMWIKEVQKKLTASKTFGHEEDSLDSSLMQI